MKNNKAFTERLRNGDLLIGTLISLNSPEIAEIISHTDYDWLFIDAEHGAFNPQQTQAMLQAAGDTPSVIRIPAGDDVWIKKALDIGAAGIIVPQVHTAEQAEQIINQCKYSPVGNRGVGIGRAHTYGLGFEDTIKNANDETAVILQAESRAAIDNIEDIVKIPGLDAILIGPYDLSASLGRIGEVNHPEVQEAINRVADVCKSANIKLGYFGVNASAVKPAMDNGFTLITVGVDTLFVIKAATETLEELKSL
ncbi:MAG: 2,4-dihydroxyhept-2-ene-1,7-dioic acid aldolase [Gammaproteobacteria bacterium]|nr:MAG: 2,4-dihydroxyhept-2-ene-1,7-dioic acid aldolase [Gammaproteobacteria bacterium]